MSLISDLEALVDPGGNPKAISDAAAATRKLADGISNAIKELDSVAVKLEKSWRGIGDKQDDSAAAAYQKSWGQFSAATADFVKQLNSAAESIDKTSQALQYAHTQAVKVRWLLAFSVVLSAVSVAKFAVADVAEAVAAAAVTEEVIDYQAFYIAGTVRGMASVATQFTLGVLSDAGGLVMEKGWKDHLNPFDIKNWTADDISNVLLGGVTSLGLGVAFNDMAKLNAFQEAHPIWSAGIWGGVGTFSWSVPWEFWVQGQSPFDLKTWGDIMASTVTSAGLAPGLAAVGSRDSVLGNIVGPKGDTRIPGVTWSDVANNAYVIPITGAKYILFTGGTQPSTVNGPDTPGSAGTAPVPDVSSPQAPTIPSHIGGGTVPVTDGQSLFDIAGEQYGNSNLYPVLQAANPNTVAADGTIQPGTHLLVPVLPKLPVNSTAQVVQPGQTLSDIAGGNVAREHQIAQLNGIANLSKVYPGQVIIVPPED